MAAILSVNVAGLLLIGLAIFLFVIDAYATTHGILTGGGIVAFLIGSLMLFDRHTPFFHLSLSYIIPGVLLTAAFFVVVIGQRLRAQRLPVKVGMETFVGKLVNTVTPIDSHGGMVFVEGEYWNATSEVPVEKGRIVEISAVEGLSVKVKPKI